MPEGPFARSSATRRRTVVTGLAVAFVTLACGGLLGAAALAPAPAVVLPLIIVACLACPMLAVAEFVTSVSGWREPPDDRALEELRRDLSRLPETEHPLDG